MGNGQRQPWSGLSPKRKLDSALIYYNEALDLLEGREYYSEQAQVLCGIALLYANQSRLDEGIAYGKRAVEAAAKVRIWI